MRLQTLQRLSRLALAVVLLLSVGSAVLVYHASPLRDPTFQPNSGNAGTLVPALQGVRESDWLTGATVLAALLAASLTLTLFLHSYQRSLTTPPWRQPDGWLRGLTQMVLWFSAGVCLFGVGWIGWFAYLSAQWLVD